MTPSQLARCIDHTLLKPEATAIQIDRLCDEAAAYGFAAVCINPIFVARAARRLRNCPTRIATVAGFPLGANLTRVKAEEARRAIEDGAMEIDMVLRIGDLVAGELAAVTDDIATVAEAVHSASPGHLLKVIIETAVLSDDHIIAACGCCTAARADFVKTSTGFHPAGGATVHAVELLRRHAGTMQIKAAGGIRDLATAQAMLAAGASRLGMSASVAVLRELQGRAEETPHPS